MQATCPKCNSTHTHTIGLMMVKCDACGYLAHRAQFQPRPPKPHVKPPDFSNLTAEEINI
jgi:ribosomal protein L37AE/L43A